MMRRLIFAAALLGLPVLAIPVHAQEQNDGTLHVLRPIIHAEQEDAEFCLEFDHDLDAADHRHAVASVKLESGGKNLPAVSRNIGIAGNLLCLSSLQHQKDYRLVVTGLRGAKGEKLTSPYSFGFSISDRKPSLAFRGETDAGGIIRWSDNDVILRALNVPLAQLELYRVTDPAIMTEAWRTRRQASLAPSESATFAHDHGQRVWKGDIEIGGEANKTIAQAIPLNDDAGDPPPGLYLATARTPESKSETETLGATGAIWLLRSGLRLGAMRDAKGFYALAEKADGSGVLKDIRLTIEDANGQKLAEGKSGPDGTAFFPLPDDKQNAAVVLSGFTDAGDADFADLKRAPRFTLPGNEISLVPDRAFYLPGAPVSVDLRARDGEGHVMPVADAILQLQWPDGNFYASFPAAADANGAGHISFPAPVAGGEWNLVWQRGDGGVLTHGILHVTPNASAPRFEMSADHSPASADGTLSLTVKSLAGDGKPSPYLAGRIFGAWMAPDHIFQEWKDYHFGKGETAPGDAAPLASFVTDEKGEATVHLALVPPNEGSLLHAVVLRAQGGRAEGVAAPAPLTLPVRPGENIVGIKPLAPEGRFPENGLARFSIIVLDAEGHRQSEDDLTYQIYEEGRSFDWQQAEGRWDYKPQQQNRRIGGGGLTLDTGRENIIEWPVTAGSYRLEISDADGVVRASVGFSAGWGIDQVAPALAPLALTPSAPILHPGEEAKIRFNLDGPSMVSAFIGDDHIRKLMHLPMAKGENTISFVPDKDWGNRISIHIAADNLNLAGQTVLPLLPQGQNTVEAAATNEAAPAKGFEVEPQFPPFLREGDAVRLNLNFKNNTAGTASYRLAATAPAGVKIFGLGEAPASLLAGQAKNISLNLNFARAGDIDIKADIATLAGLHETPQWIIPVYADDARLVSSGTQKIDPHQGWTAPAEKNRSKTESDLFFIAPAPLFTLPALLSDVLAAHPFTTGEISGVMEILRLWHETIAAAGLQTEAALTIERHDLLLRLMARQKSDGGFASTPSAASDVLSTAQALTALGHADAPLAKPAVELAAGWLRHQLENTWFDEKERPARAAAYAALAETGRLDTASLHYFGDTSADKALPPLAAAQLAFAFAASGDQGSASYWLDASGARKNPNDIGPQLFRILAANGLFDPQALLPSMERAAAEMEKNNARDIKSVNGFLHALWDLQQRKGVWHVTLGAEKRNPTGVLVVPEKPASVIYNIGDDPLFLARAHESVSVMQGPIARHVYTLSGAEVGASAPLAQGQIYLVVLEGPWSAKNENSLVAIHDDLSPGLGATGCMPPAPIEADDTLAWLKGQGLTAFVDCEISGGNVDMTVRKDKGGNGWRVAYLAKSGFSGTFGLAPPSARNLDGERDVMQGPKTRIETR